MKLNKEYQSLAGFGKTALLAPHTADKIQITFDIAKFASYDEETASYILEKGEYIVRVGNSSRNTQPAAVIVLDETAVVSVHENICPVHKEFEKLTEPAVKPLPADETVPRINISAKDIKTVTQKNVTYILTYICMSHCVCLCIFVLHSFFLTGQKQSRKTK